MKNRNERIRAWHFTGDTLRDGKPVPPVGQTLTHTGAIALCESGLHASRDPFDALQYAPGVTLHLVELWEDVEEEEEGNKLVARNRVIVQSCDMEKELRLFACWCVRNTPIGGGRTLWDLLYDERSRNAVEVAEKFANGETTKEELRAAWDAAWDAAWGAARGAAWDAAWDAAWYAARGAAWDAAWDAAWGAARDAARGAGCDEAKNFHSKEFNRLVKKKFNLK